MADSQAAQGEEQAPEGESLPKYSWEEIEKHNSIESLWVVVDDTVYDVTKFAEEVREETYMYSL